MLPNLIVIGAAKAGTTTLHRLLDLHPEIAMSQDKELVFFVDPDDTRETPRRVRRGRWALGQAWYERQFDGTAPVRGESSPRYTAWPQSGGVPRRMAQLVPDARLVYIVRDPIARLVSEHHMHVQLADERRSLAATLTDLDTAPSVARSRYMTQIEQYLEHFAREQLLVLDTDQLAADPGGALAQVFAHVGVDLSFRSPKFAERHNEGSARRVRTGHGDAAVAVLDRVLGEERSLRLRTAAPPAFYRPFTRPLAPPELPPATRAALEAHLRPEAEALRAFTGLRFERWSV